MNIAVLFQGLLSRIVVSYFPKEKYIVAAKSSLKNYYLCYRSKLNSGYFFKTRLILNFYCLLALIHV